MNISVVLKFHSDAVDVSMLRKDIDFSSGTPSYGSPEQASCEPNLDARSDIYSLACVAYEMIAGRKPFTGETTQQIVSLRFRVPPPPLQKFAPDVPIEVAVAIERA